MKEMFELLETAGDFCVYDKCGRLTSFCILPHQRDKPFVMTGCVCLVFSIVVVVVAVYCSSYDPGIRNSGVMMFSLLLVISGTWLNGIDMYWIY